MDLGKQGISANESTLCPRARAPLSVAPTPELATGLLEKRRMPHLLFSDDLFLANPELESHLGIWAVASSPKAGPALLSALVPGVPGLKRGHFPLAHLPGQPGRAGLATLQHRYYSVVAQ